MKLRDQVRIEHTHTSPSNMQWQTIDGGEDRVINLSESALPEDRAGLMKLEGSITHFARDLVSFLVRLSKGQAPAPRTDVR